MDRVTYSVPVIETSWGKNQEQFTIFVTEKKIDGVQTSTDIYISIPSLCRALGIDHHSQIRRIKRNEGMAGHYRQFILKTVGGAQPTTCLAVEAISLWLEGIRLRPAGSQFQFYREHLAAMITTACSASFKNDPEEEYYQLPSSPKKVMIIETPSTADQLNTETIASRYDLLADISRVKETTIVRNHLFEEDTALRESCLADLLHWTRDETNAFIPYYIASNHLQVYVSHPAKEIELSVALQRIGQLGMSTVLTGRIAFWLWNLRRTDPQCSSDGWVALQVDEILQLRGIRQHSRVVSSQSGVRVSDGYYESKYKQQVYQDLQLLNDCYIRRYMHLLDTNQNEREVYFDAPYLRVSFMMESCPGEDSIIGVAVKPGEWMPQKLREAFHRLAGIDSKIFQLNPKYDQLAMFLALYLSERWRHQVQQAPLVGDQEDLYAPYREPLRMSTLLEASMIRIDRKHLTTRFTGRIEAALNKLFARGILSFPPQCLSTIDRTHNWGKAWLEAYWRLLPALDAPEPISQLTPGGETIESKKRRKRESAR